MSSRRRWPNAYTRARLVASTAMCITVLLASTLAVFVAWAIHPLLPVAPYGAAILWLAIVWYLLWVLDISLKGLRNGKTRDQDRP